RRQATDGHPTFGQEGAVARQELRALQPSRHTPAGGGFEPFRFGGRQPHLCGAYRDRTAEGMLRATLGHGRSLDDRLGRNAINGTYRGDLRRAEGERAGLVEGHRVDQREALEVPSALDDRPLARRAPDGTEN